MPHPETERLLDAAFPPSGPCGICGRGWARHRLCDAIRGNFKAGDSAERIAANYDVPLGAVNILVRLSGSAYGWWLRNEGRPSADEGA